jgi:hypothetical protein
MGFQELPDISPSATRKAVLEKSVQNPLSLYPAGMGVLGGVAMALFGFNPVTVSVAAFGIGVSAASFGVNYFLRHGTLEKQHLERIFAELDSRRMNTLFQLKKSISVLREDNKKKIREFAGQGQVQFAMVEERFETVKNLLDRKLKKGEITYLRYLGASETVFIAVLDSLERAISLMKSNQAIDEEYILERLHALESLSIMEEADIREKETLQERYDLAKDLEKRISTLLTENEVAITKMDQLNSSLADLNIIQGRGAQKLEQAIEDMEHLASRVHQYGG